MRRREITFVALLAAVGGAAGGAILWMRDGTGKVESAAGTARPSDAAAPRGAPALETADPAAAAPLDDDAKVAASDRARPDVDARRAVEPAPEVAFVGLVMIRNAPEDAPPEEGALILRVVGSAAPLRRIEVAVKESRFAGRGPLGAEVEVERLELSGREVATREQRWPLSKRWIEIAATWAPARVLHVVDAGSGRELEDVTVRWEAHVEGVSEFVGSFPFAAGARRSGSPNGHASPLRFFGDSARLDFVVHAADHGDERVTLDPRDTEVTVELRPAASVRVKVEPWPVAAADDASADRRGHPAVFVACADRVGDESYGAARSRAEERWAERAPPSLRAAVSAALDRRALRGAAATTPLRHVAAIDEKGVARFDDLCDGSWVAWIDDLERGLPRADGSVVGRLVPTLDATDGAWRHDPVPFTADAGGRTEVVLRSEVRRVEACSVVVHAVDARSGAELDLGDADVRVIALDGSGASGFRDVLVQQGVVIGSDAPSRAADGAIRATAGLAQLLVDPRSRLDYEPSETIVELAPGANDVRVALARVEGVVVAIVRDLFASADGTPVELGELRLTGGGRDLRSGLGWRSGRFVQPTLLLHRFRPLPPGRYELHVPENAGFERAGAIPVDVREGETTLVELRWVKEPTAAGEVGGASDR